MKWSKLLLNLVTNASVAILDLPPARVVAHPGLFRLERDAFREAVRVMRAFGLRAVSLPGYPVPALVSLMASHAASAGAGGRRCPPCGRTSSAARPRAR